jgi:AcrR family transcriptional regulator
VQAGVWDTTRRVALDAVGADAARDWAVRALRKGRRTSAPTSALPRRRGPAARRRQLLDAAVALLAEGGAAAVTVEAVVSRLGVSRPVFYSHFPHRSALLAAIYDEYATVVLNAMNAVSVDGLPLEEQVRRTTVAYFDAVGGFGVVVRALVATAPGDEVVEAARRRLRRAAEDRALHQVRRRPRVDEGALRLALRLVNAMAEQAATEWLEGRATRRLVERVHVNAAVAVLTPLVRQT